MDVPAQHEYFGGQRRPADRRRYRVVMRGCDASTYIIGGTYREILRPERLVFTWQWEGEAMPKAQTLVTVTFTEGDGGTRLHMHHSGFPGGRHAGLAHPGPELHVQSPQRPARRARHRGDGQLARRSAQHLQPEVGRFTVFMDPAGAVLGAIRGKSTG